MVRFFAEIRKGKDAQNTKVFYYYSYFTYSIRFYSSDPFKCII